MEICGRHIVAPSGHLTFIQPLAIDSHVHFYKSNVPIQQGRHTAGYMPRD